MRVRIYTLFYLVIMICYVLRPVLPYIEYAANKDYIIRHLCVNRNVPHSTCNGHCHLQKEIEKSQSDTPAENNNGKDKVQNNNVDDHLLTSSFQVAPDEVVLQEFGSKDFSLISTVPEPIFIPPEIVDC
jgi:hypothetical protein